MSFIRLDGIIRINRGSHNLSRVNRNRTLLNGSNLSILRKLYNLNHSTLKSNPNNKISKRLTKSMSHLTYYSTLQVQPSNNKHLYDNRYLFRGSLSFFRLRKRHLP